MLGLTLGGPQASPMTSNIRRARGTTGQAMIDSTDTWVQYRGRWTVNRYFACSAVMRVLVETRTSSLSVRTVSYLEERGN